MNESCSLDNWRKASNVSLSSHWCTAPESALCEEKATLTSLGCSTLKLPMHCLTLLRSNLGCTFADQLHCTVTPPLLCTCCSSQAMQLLLHAAHAAHQTVGMLQVGGTLWTWKELPLKTISGFHSSSRIPQKLSRVFQTPLCWHIILISRIGHFLSRLRC